MKPIIAGLIFVLLLFAGKGWGQNTPNKTPTVGIQAATKPDSAPLTMSKADWNDYKAARDAKDYAKAELLTVYPDVKAWMENNQGFECFKKGDYVNAHIHFVKALKLAVTADKVGRSGGMNRMRKLIKRDEEAIRWHEAHPDDSEEVAGYDAEGNTLTSK